MLCCCRVAPDMKPLAHTAVHVIIKETEVVEAMQAAGTEAVAAMEAGGAGEALLGKPGSRAAAPQTGLTPLRIWTETADEATAQVV